MGRVGPVQIVFYVGVYSALELEGIEVGIVVFGVALTDQVNLG